MKKNTGVLCKCGGTMNPIRIDTEYGSTEYQCELCKNEFSIWLDMFRQDASPQDNNLVKSDEMALREFLWLNHGHTGQYGDDGEMQCQMCCHYQCTDYKREPLSKVINSSIKARFDVNIAKRHC